MKDCLSHQRTLSQKTTSVDFLRNTFPLFSKENISQILNYYPSTNASVSDTPKFATSGTTTSTAVNESTFGTGQQQRAEVCSPTQGDDFLHVTYEFPHHHLNTTANPPQQNVYAEATFVCPSYCLADAFTTNNRKAYKYQYSVIGAEHAAELSSLVGAPTPNQGPAFNKAFMNIWGNFITQGNPFISAQIANGPNSTRTTNPATDWPPWTLAKRYQINLNESGGTAFQAPSLIPDSPNITEFGGPGLRNSFELVNAYTWERGRGARCDFWRSVGSIVPD